MCSRQFLTEVKNEREITGKSIFIESRIAESTISDYLNGKKDITSETLWRMIEAMDRISPGATRDFGLKVIGDSGFDDLMESLSDDELYELFTKVAAYLRTRQVTNRELVF